MAKKDIIALERRVKEVFANDKASGDMYQSIKDLAEAILVVKRMAYNSTEVDEISHILASDFYVKINHEGLIVEKWTKYIRLRLYNFRGAYLRETQKVELEIPDVIEAEEFCSTMFGYDRQRRTSKYGSDLVDFELEDLVASLSDKVLDIFDNYVHYKVGTDLYESTKLSVMLSINDKLQYDRGRIILINLPRSDEDYIRFLVTLIYKRLGVYLRKYVGDELSSRTEMHELLYNPFNALGIDD